MMFESSTTSPRTYHYNGHNIKDTGNIIEVDENFTVNRDDVIRQLKNIRFSRGFIDLFVVKQKIPLEICIAAQMKEDYDAARRKKYYGT